MLRRFRKHDERLVTDLQGIWDFVFLGDVDAQGFDIHALEYKEYMAVPGCFDATPAYAGKRGLAAYRTWITLNAAALHRLVFDGVHHWCRIFVNDKAVCEHNWGFTLFTVDLTHFTPGTCELVVLVDNRFDYNRSPLHHEYYDWYHFGGITRGIELHNLDALWIEEMRVVTTDLALPAVTVTVTYKAIAVPGTVQFVLTWNDRPVLEEEINLTALSGHITRTLALPGAALWKPDSPCLHLLHARLGTDDMRERIGIRQVEAAGRELLINKQPVQLLGFNRHESHPQFGHSQSAALLVADIQQIKELGCNFVRGSHYPQDQLFLDLCDETGICVWCEAIGWQNNAEHLTNRHFMQAQQMHIREMVAAAINHPAVIMWGILNEGHSHDTRCVPAYRELLNLLRSLDPTRPVTYAGNHPFDDICYALADVIAVNTYPGWYHGSLAEIPRMLDEITAHLDAGPAAAKPILISEIGAGAIPGWRDWNNGRWTEQYQAELLGIVIRHLFIDRRRVCGIAIWLFNDFRTPDGVFRPRGYNDKGIVDEYRQPKLAYRTVQQLFVPLKSAKGNTGN